MLARVERTAVFNIKPAVWRPYRGKIYSISRGNTHWYRSRPYSTVAVFGVGLFRHRIGEINCKTDE